MPGFTRGSHYAKAIMKRRGVGEGEKGVVQFHIGVREGKIRKRRRIGEKCENPF